MRTITLDSETEKIFRIVKRELGRTGLCDREFLEQIIFGH